MKLIKPGDKEWLEKEGYDKKIFLDEKDLKNKGSLVQEIRIKPGQTAKNHYHKKQTEIFYFLNQNGFWLVNGKRLDPKTGEILVIEPIDRHEVANNSSEDYLYLAFKIKYDPRDFYWE